MPKLTHLDNTGKAHMVDVAMKEPTARIARAAGEVHMDQGATEMIRDGLVPKGDVLAVARIAGIMAAKRTSELIPLCHPIPISSVTVDCTIADYGVSVEAAVNVLGATGVEMEALTAVTVACLAIYDMVKAVDRSAVIEHVRLLEKDGGKSGHYLRSQGVD